mmetsp:Transcript_21558/g.46891  ORF Transcript_21558/g.46891 Transcript_21558/m.46891 type:complete len:319 (-) Transcript_21558:39-995(-)
MVMPNDQFLFCLCLLICSLLSNAFDIAAPNNNCWRQGVGARLDEAWRSNMHGNFDNGIKHQEHLLPRQHGPRRTCMSVRCGGVGADDKDIGKATNDDDNMRISTKNPASIIAKWYMNQLETRELRTKFISSAILALVGDVCAQKVGHYMLTTKNLLPRLDKRRMMAMFADGLVCTGPLLHFVYKFYEWVLPTSSHVKSMNIMDDDQTDNSSATETKRSFSAALAHVLFDNFVTVIVYVGLLMAFTGLIEGRYKSIPHELKHDLIPAVIVSWKVSILGFAPLQLMSFHFLPVKLRVLAVNVLDVIWITVMSYVTHRNRH